VDSKLVDRQWLRVRMSVSLCFSASVVWFALVRPTSSTRYLRRPDLKYSGYRECLPSTSVWFVAGRSHENSHVQLRRRFNFLSFLLIGCKVVPVRIGSGLFENNSFRPSSKPHTRETQRSKRCGEQKTSTPFSQTNKLILFANGTEAAIHYTNSSCQQQHE
jgi:hypothetical protein